LTYVPEFLGMVRVPRFIEARQLLIYFNYRNSLLTGILVVKISMNNNSIVNSVTQFSGFRTVSKKISVPSVPLRKFFCVYPGEIFAKQAVALRLI